jgi:hemoglobin/transferrin/lactoferrin receptor protein
MQPTLLNTAIWIALATPTLAFAQTATTSTVAATELDTITVTATRTERAIQDVPNSVGVIERERMDRELVRDLKDLFRYEPGISVTSSFGRFGLGDIRIRGLGGNRVRIETDGIAVPDAFAIGSFSNANRNFVDLDTLKRVEVVRGPGSALYGSDALGGVVAFVTKDPADYLAPDKHAHFDFKLGYESENQGLFGGATAAFGGERWSGLVALGHRQGQETRNQGEIATTDATRTQANPQSSDGRSLLTKLVFAPSVNQRFKLTVEGNEDQTDTNVLSSRGAAVTPPGAPVVHTLSLLGDDHQARARIALAHEADALEIGFADALQWQVYRQDSETTQRTREERVTLIGGSPVNPTRREREFNFDQRVYGLEATLHKALATGGVEHALTYGVEYAHTSIKQKRDGRATNLTTGAATGTILPDVFPVRDFPVSTTQVAALFVQDEISFHDGAFRLVPALRVDRYELDPKPDAIFTADNPGVAVQPIRETAVSPKLGAVWHFTPDWSLFAGYQHGFRAPPYNDVNLGFTNLQFGYTAIPNPDLKPETSDGLELGLRYAGRSAHAELSAYYNRYDDFIESFRVVSAPPQTPLMVFQSQNVADATIHGVELRGGIDFGAVSDALVGWSLRGSVAWSKGEDETAHRPLATIDPLRGALGAAYERGTWGIELAGRFAGRKHDLPQAGQFAPPGYGVLDLLAHWDFAPGAKVNLGVFNLADRKYWDWADVPGVMATSAVLDRYTRPGRSVGFSLAFAW